MYFFLFLIGGLLGFFGLIGSICALSYEVGNPDVSGSLTSLMIGVLGIALAIAAYKAEFGNNNS